MSRKYFASKNKDNKPAVWIDEGFGYTYVFKTYETEKKAIKVANDLQKTFELCKLREREEMELEKRKIDVYKKNRGWYKPHDNY